MSRSWLRPTKPSVEQKLADAIETVGSADAAAGHDSVRALYVTGPNGGTRHVLPKGLVTLGRGAEATIVVNDPRVSRSHAALHVGKEIHLSDLGSANGTFLGSERLAAGDALPLADGQSFFIGDSALVVRPTSLRRVNPQRLSSLDEVKRHIAGAGPLVVVGVRSVERTQAWIHEAILGELLTSPRDFMLRLERTELLLAFEGQTRADLAPIERAILERLVAWGTMADVRARLFGAEEIERADDLRSLFTSKGQGTRLGGKVVLEDPAIKALEQTVVRVAPAPVSVLILGETGAGKDVFAALLHELSPRAHKPFLGLNCASVPETLLESELFGYERGAFTGATTAKPGLLEAADGGTVFLDEVGDLPLSLQAKLLRVIESHDVTRLGALKPRTIDVRFVAATNHDLAKDVADGRFRQDFYYRLNSVTLTVPPLRDRPGDIEPLARFFLENARVRLEIPDLRFSATALEALGEHAWPGNVRELKSTVERAALLAQTPFIEPSDLGLAESDESAAFQRREFAATEVPDSGATEAERERIVRALEECGGNQSRAAKLLGMSRRTLVRRIAQLGLPRPRE